MKIYLTTDTQQVSKSFFGSWIVYDKKTGRSHKVSRLVSKWFSKVVNIAIARGFDIKHDPYAIGAVFSLLLGCDSLEHSPSHQDELLHWTDDQIAAALYASYDDLLIKHRWNPARLA